MSEATNTNNSRTHRKRLHWLASLLRFFFIAWVIVRPLGIVRSKFMTSLVQMQLTVLRHQSATEQIIEDNFQGKKEMKSKIYFNIRVNQMLPTPGIEPGPRR